MYFTLKNHQSSFAATVHGNTMERLSYDAWGRRRNPDGFGYDNVTHTFDRGYTLHEHYDAFGLVNMNGRMYDPVMSSFLSVDRYVQQPGNSQGFNRYAYCMYNPLKYTDPSGEIFGVDDIMFVMLCSSISSVIINGAVNVCNGRNFYDGSYGAFMGGLASTAIGGTVGGAVAGVVGTEGFICGGITGASAGLFGGYAGGAVGAWCNGASMDDCMKAGLIGGAIGTVTGFVSGGIQGGVYARKNGGDFWSGAGIEYTRNADPNVSWDVEMEEGMEYSTDFLNRFKAANGLDVDSPSNLNESYADGVTISGKSKYHYKGSWLTDENEVEKVYATTINIGYGRYNTYYAQASFSCPEELYLTITHEYFHLYLYNVEGKGVKYNKDYHHASTSRFEYAQAKRWNYRVDYYKSIMDSYKNMIANGRYATYSIYFVPISSRPIIP